METSLTRDMATPISKFNEMVGVKGVVGCDEYNFAKAGGKGGKEVGAGRVEGENRGEGKRFRISGGGKGATSSVEKKIRVCGGLNNTGGFETRMRLDSSYDELSMYSGRGRKVSTKTTKLRARVVEEEDTKGPADYGVYRYNIPFDFTL